MRRLLVLAVVTLGVLTGPLVASSAALCCTPYGPYSSYSSCQSSAGNREMHGYIITKPCHYRSSKFITDGWYYYAYVPG